MQYCCRNGNVEISAALIAYRNKRVPECKNPTIVNKRKFHQTIAHSEIAKVNFQQTSQPFIFFRFQTIQTSDFNRNFGSEFVRPSPKVPTPAVNGIGHCNWKCYAEFNCSIRLKTMRKPLIMRSLQRWMNIGSYDSQELKEALVSLECFLQTFLVQRKRITYGSHAISIFATDI